MEKFLLQGKYSNIFFFHKNIFLLKSISRTVTSLPRLRPKEFFQLLKGQVGVWLKIFLDLNIFLQGRVVNNSRMEDASSGVYSRANSSALSLVKMPFNICIFVFQHVVSNYCAILSSIVKHRFHVWLKVFGFTAARQNIKQDLVAVLQKVVEVISTLIRSSSSCKLYSSFRSPPLSPTKCCSSR